MSAEPLRVRDLMSAPAVTAPPSATVRELAAAMLANRVGSVVIDDPDDPGVPAGIVTETDFQVEERPLPETSFKWPRAFGTFVWSERSLEDLYDLMRDREARAVMSAPVVTVGAGQELWEAVRAMVSNEVKRVPVVEEGRLVGLLARHDLLKCLVRGNGPAA